MTNDERSDTALDLRGRTAIHEAGHAVAGLILGREFTSVTIESDGLGVGVYGLTEFVPIVGFHSEVVEGADTATDRHTVWRALVTVLAGPAAEEVVTGELALDGENNNDEGQAIDMAGSLAESFRDVDRYLEAALEEARGLWHGPMWWRAVESLAQALDAHGHLNFEDAAQAAGVELRHPPVRDPYELIRRS